jgi:two-component system nitrate/nitrite response regulator NarP
METLTPREQQIAEAVSRGLRNRQIASEFGISPETVKRHLATIYDKLAIRSRVELAMHIVRSYGVQAFVAAHPKEQAAFEANP